MNIALVTIAFFSHPKFFIILFFASSVDNYTIHAYSYNLMDFRFIFSTTWSMTLKLNLWLDYYNTSNEGQISLKKHAQNHVYFIGIKIKEFTTSISILLITVEFSRNILITLAQNLIFFIFNYFSTCISYAKLIVCFETVNFNGFRSGFFRLKIHRTATICKIHLMFLPSVMTWHAEGMMKQFLHFR